MLPEPQQMSELIERLAQHRTIRDIPRHELEWLVAHGTLRHLEVGELISSPRLGVVENLMILLSGQIGFYRERGGTQRRMIEWKAGDITGNLPYSRMTTPPGEGRVEEPGDIFLVHRDHFPSMVHECEQLTSRLVWAMVDRARYFQKDDLQRERLISLGKLAAGLAHELDNPTAAALRSSKMLGTLLEDSDLAARALGEIGIPAEQFEALQKIRTGCLTSSVEQVRSPLEQARHEEEISDWLDDRGIEGPVVEALSDAPVTLQTLDDLAKKLDPRALEPAVRWLATGCALLSVAAEIQHASARTSELVKAVKGFSQVDRSATPQDVDVEEGLKQTLAMLRSKAKGKSVQVDIKVEPGLPKVQGVSGELNQIWHNLIDNALDAVSDGGAVKVSAKCWGDNVVVCIEDDGPGIPPEIQSRIFEPFFTTKPVGEGTGLGLDIVERLVDSQKGSVNVTSKPGHTAFQVTLPVPANAKQGAVS